MRRYIEESGLPMNVLVDESRQVLKAYGIWHRIGLDAWNTARPALFLIGRTGRIEAIWVGERQTEFPDRAEIDQALAKEERGTNESP